MAKHFAMLSIMVLMLSSNYAFFMWYLTIQPWYLTIQPWYTGGNSSSHQVCNNSFLTLLLLLKYLLHQHHCCYVNFAKFAKFYTTDQHMQYSSGDTSPRACKPKNTSFAQFACYCATVIYEHSSLLKSPVCRGAECGDHNLLDYCPLPGTAST